MDSFISSISDISLNKISPENLSSWYNLKFLKHFKSNSWAFLTISSKITPGM